MASILKKDVDSEKVSSFPSSYTDNEKEEIRNQVENATAAQDLAVVKDSLKEFKPRKKGIMLPVLVNIFALVLIVGGYFVANAFFQTRQQGLRTKTDTLFSAESNILSKVIAETKGQLDAKNQEIEKIKSDLDRLSQEKTKLTASFEDRVSQKSKQLRQSMQSAIDAERKRLVNSGLKKSEVETHINAFTDQKNQENERLLEDFKKQVRAEIDQRNKEFADLQQKLTVSMADQEKLQADLEAKTKKEENSLQVQLTEKTMILDRLNKDQAELDEFNQRLDNIFQQIQGSIEKADFTSAAQAALQVQKTVEQGLSSSNEQIKRRSNDLVPLEKGLIRNIESLKNLKVVNTDQLDAFKLQVKKAQLIDNESERVSIVQNAASEIPVLQTALQILETYDIQKAIAQLKNELQTQKENYEQQLNAGKMDQTDWASKQVQWQTEKAMLEKQLAEEKEKGKDKEKNTQIQSDTLADISKKLKDALDKVSLLTVENTNLQKQLVDAKKDKDNLSGQLKDLQVQVRALSETANSQNPKPVRAKAFSDVLLLTSYLRGASNHAKKDQDELTLLASEDEAFRDAVNSIQSLVREGTRETFIKTDKSVLWGSLVLIDHFNVVAEILTNSDGQVNQAVEIRRSETNRESLLARGIVTKIDGHRAEIKIIAYRDQKNFPSSGDPVYLIAP